MYICSYNAFQLSAVFIHSGTLQLRDQDYLRFQFLGAKNAWLGCPYTVCDSRICPSSSSAYLNFQRCHGEIFG